MQQFRHPLSHFAARLLRLARGEAGAGLVLIAAAAVALVLANSGGAHFYHALLHSPLGLAPAGADWSLHDWINDALMTVFFLAVGLEIKRELLDGELASPARRRLPVLAAAAGMAAPALVYLLIAGTAPPLGAGWAIPAATDIAFALGVLALLGPRVPPSLRLFLLTVAIVDDLGAVAIIALFYTAGVDVGWLAAAGAALLALFCLNRLRVASGWAYAPLLLALWYCVLHSGVHATIAGVLGAFTIPLALDRRGDSLLLRMEHGLLPWNLYLVVPLFGFANAGVALAGGSAAAPAALPLAVGLGLLLGKQAGIFGAIIAGERLGLGHAPAGASRMQLWGLSLLCGIGFTMSLFIGALAFPAHPALVDGARIGVLAGSGLSALAGWLVLRLAAPRG